ncbi:MAG: ABC transporter permease [Lentisphaeria bacterium]|nr:ABC transporter permease [Lentisphaeria bacterium]
MLQYTAKRLLYSLFIIFGVLVITFVLFRVAAGDPASTVLGKNPSAEELENMRELLGSHKPLFWGSRQHTEIYAQADFSSFRHLTSLSVICKKDAYRDGGLYLADGERCIFERLFEQKKEQGKFVPVYVTIYGKGVFTVDGKEVFTDGKKEIELSIAPENLVIAVPEGKRSRLQKVVFTRKARVFLDSQFAASITELISFSSRFPFVSFFNFGKTLHTREEIRTKLWKGIFPSLSLMIPVFLGELLFGIVFAMISCIYRGGLPDRILMILSVAGMSISYLVLIIAGQWFFAYTLNLFPVWGWGRMEYIFLPVLLGIINGTGGGVRFYRTVFLNEIHKEYLRTAAAKGVAPFFIYFKHLLKNALIPIITRCSTLLPFLFTGSLLLETFFGIPGLGYEGVNALNDGDLQMLKGLVILSAFLFVFINLLTDLLYAWADPRIRLEKKS